MLGGVLVWYIDAMDTPTTDYLSALGIDFQVKSHAEQALTSEDAARERGVRTSQIVKCMVGRTDTDEVVVMLIPGDKRLKSSKAKKFVGAKMLELIPAEELESRFGLTVGAISPTQLVEHARILMDPTVLEEEDVDISAGHPLAGVELKAEELKEAVGAEMVSMISHNS